MPPKLSCTRLRGKTPYRDQAWQCLLQHQGKTGNCCLSATCFTNSDISLRVVSLIFRGLDLLKILIPSKKTDFRYGKHQFSETAAKMEFRSRSTHKSQALGLTCVRSQSSREIENVTISEFSTFLKLTNLVREQFLLRLTLFTLFAVNG